MITQNLIRIARLFSCIGVVLLLSACSSVAYYSQSVIGHSRLMLAREPINKVLENADEKLKSKLLLSKQLKQFSVTELGLPVSRSYDSYVTLDRDFPVWTVVAAPQFSLQARQWCYPVIGCASYRGYFSRSSALSYARKLQSKGFETQVDGTPAYSTLGWFADPLLPSMMRYEDVDFAETLFHEIAHQKLYVNGDSDFNEAFASLVGEVGTIRWLELHRPSDLVHYRKSLEVRQQFYSLVSTSELELRRLYQSGSNKSIMLLAKQRIIQNLRLKYERLKTSEWNGAQWYRAWFDGDLNNAKFSSLSTYRNQVPALRALLEACGENLSKFYTVLSGAKKINQKVAIPSACSELDYD